MTNDANCLCPGPGDAAFGPVTDNEFLNRVILDPRHITKDGRLKSQFADSASLRRLDLSASRERYIDEEGMVRKAQTIMSSSPGGTGGGAVGYATTSVRLLREATGDDQEEVYLRHLCVIDSRIDDANEKDETHASIGFSEATSNALSDDDLLLIRKWIAKHFGRSISLFAKPIK